MAASFLGSLELMDETYIGGRPRTSNKHGKDDDTLKTGSATKKTPVIGTVERGGSGYGDNDFTNGDCLCCYRVSSSNINPDGSKLKTDESNVYFQVRDFIAHEVIRHSDLFVRGDVHTNIIEGFRSLLKRAWYGQHHHYNREFLPLYVSGHLSCHLDSLDSHRG